MSIYENREIWGHLNSLFFYNYDMQDGILYFFLTMESDYRKKKARLHRNFIK